MEYKKVYSPEELADLQAWFAARMNRLPKEFDLLPGVHIFDVPFFVESINLVIGQHSENPTYGANIRLLFTFREKLQEQLGL